MFMEINMFSRMRMVWEMLVLMFLSMFSKTNGGGGGGYGDGRRMNNRLPSSCSRGSEAGGVNGVSYCMSCRVAVETNNVLGLRTVPTQRMSYVENYMLGGQYEKDLNVVMEQISTYLDGIIVSNDGMDAWILDVDDSCLSNLLYYREKRFGCDPFDPIAFNKWVLKGMCPAIPPVLKLFKKLVSEGFKVFLLTGRDEAGLGQATLDNLHNQGYLGYERLIMRSEAYKGKGAVAFKSEIRKELIKGEGYRIWGNIGDQWSDLLGDLPGGDTFKLPNPMYIIP